MKTTRATWYEVWIKKAFGAKLADRFNNIREAKTAMVRAREKETSLGYKPSEYMVMIVDTIRTMDKDGETISETTTYARV